MARRLLDGNGGGRWVFCCALLCHCGAADGDGLFAGATRSSEGPSMTAAPGSASSPAIAAPSAAARAEEPPGAAVSAAAPQSPEPTPAGNPPAVATPSASPSSPEPSDDLPPDEPEAPVAAPPAGEALEPEPAAVPSVIQIERARWDEEDEQLEVRGEVSSTAVTLSVEFLDRSEPVPNLDGTFSVEFSDVEEQPDQVSVTASDGATATLRVEVD